MSLIKSYTRHGVIRQKMFCRDLKILMFETISNHPWGLAVRFAEHHGNGAADWGSSAAPPGAGWFANLSSSI